jgi:hypothetical protein
MTFFAANVAILAQVGFVRLQLCKMPSDMATFFSTDKTN